MQPLTGLWGCGDIALIYRYGSPNGLLRNGNAFIATDMEALTGFCGMETPSSTDMEALTGFYGTEMPSSLQIWKP
jgi:hypothetical protein